MPDRDGDVSVVTRTPPAPRGAHAVRAGAWLREGRQAMNCQEFEIALHPYVDGELPVPVMTAADTHAAGCGQCAALARREREFRQLLSNQPREVAPPALRASIQAALRRQGRRAVLRPWLVAPALAAAVALATLV